MRLTCLLSWLRRGSMSVTSGSTNGPGMPGDAPPVPLPHVAHHRRHVLPGLQERLDPREARPQLPEQRSNRGDSPKMPARARIPVGRAAVVLWTRTAIVAGFSSEAAATRGSGGGQRDPPIDGQYELPGDGRPVTQRDG